ncbi:DEAD/DEAH box helicase [Microbacterium fluvii]|uniref:DEAD/DEAH box helicase n=1 Tax=Microbacterium fluvii TaxID=415215 RepID=A0ABW2HF58_9MICO|nr:DEAD/DEAH box helicase [Microbacterium fluvii]MCU4672032.1 DEAD/DEAH box helicase [Microbacterium fluvii]
MTAPADRPSPWRAALAAPSAGPQVPLALGVELRSRERSAGAWSAAKAQTATARMLARGTAGDLQVGLRPLSRSAATGGWIRSDVSWDVVRRASGRFDPEHVRWFRELYGIAHDARLLGGYTDASDWLTLDTVESRHLWAHLAAAEGIGIPLVPVAKDHDVSLVAQAAVDVALSGDGEGLRLDARVSIAGAEVPASTVRPVARTGLYAYALEGPRVRLTLAPAALGDAAHAVLAAAAPIFVPAGEVDEFLRDAYPRMARREPVRAAGGLTLPRPEQVSLVLVAAFAAGDVVDYRFEWVLPGTGRVPFDAAHPELDDASALRSATVQAWTDAGELPFAAAARLRGVDTAEFAAQVLPALEEVEGLRIEVTGAPKRYRELGGDPRITVSTVETTDRDWFDLGVLVEIDGRRIPFTPLFTALALRRKKLLLSDGRYFSLAHPALDRLRELIDEAAELDEWETGPRISRYQLPLWSEFEDLADEAAPAVAWRETASALREVAGVEAIAPPPGLRAELRPYQRDGCSWLAFLWRHRLGGILADDMGLGKTLQVLALLQHARETGETRPFLVVAPTSVLATWRDEAARFTPELRVRIAGETSAKAGTPLAVVAADADLVVTSYALLRLGDDEFGGIDWAIVVLDEAQFVKNPQTRLYRAAKRLRAEIVLAVTGTPLENSLVELWTLLSLTSPGLFASGRRFREEYVKPIEQGKVPENEEGGPYRAKRLDRLRRRIRPFVLRRTKELVAPELPERQEQEVRVELPAAHRARYDIVLQRERRKVLGLLDDLDRNRFIVFRSLTLLRMLALAPALIDPADARLGSSKIEALLERVDEVAAEGHRALVFSQFTSFLDLVERELDARDISYVRLDGSTRRREQVIAGFRDGDQPVFLISLKAGGFGLTLTEADHVFLLDPWWNPAAEAQAVDRTHRIGQTRPVNVYRLIAAGTIEEKVLELQQRKARLFRSVMDDDELFAQALTADDIRGLFETG